MCVRGTYKDAPPVMIPATKRLFNGLSPHAELCAKLNCELWETGKGTRAWTIGPLWQLIQILRHASGLSHSNWPPPTLCCGDLPPLEKIRKLKERRLKANIEKHNNSESLEPLPPAFFSQFRQNLYGSSRSPFNYPPDKSSAITGHIDGRGDAWLGVRSFHSSRHPECNSGKNDGNDMDKDLTASGSKDSKRDGEGADGKAGSLEGQFEMGTDSSRRLAMPVSQTVTDSGGPDDQGSSSQDMNFAETTSGESVGESDFPQSVPSSLQSAQDKADQNAKRSSDSGGDANTPPLGQPGTSTSFSSAETSQQESEFSNLVLETPDTVSVNADSTTASARSSQPEGGGFVSALKEAYDTLLDRDGFSKDFGRVPNGSKPVVGHLTTGFGCVIRRGGSLELQLCSSSGAPKSDLHLEFYTVDDEGNGKYYRINGERQYVRIPLVTQPPSTYRTIRLINEGGMLLTRSVKFLRKRRRVNRVDTNDEGPAGVIPLPAEFLRVDTRDSMLENPPPEPTVRPVPPVPPPGTTEALDALVEQLENVGSASEMGVEGSEEADDSEKESVVHEMEDFFDVVERINAQGEGAPNIAEALKEVEDEIVGGRVPKNSLNFYGAPSLVERQDYELLLLLMVGCQGSGKTKFALDLVRFGAVPWARINQDTLRGPYTKGLRVECVDKARQLINQGYCVVVDRMNFDDEQRAGFVELAQELGLTIHAVVFKLPYVDNCYNVAVRTNHEGRFQGSTQDHRDIIATTRNRLFFRGGYPNTEREGFRTLFFCETNQDYASAFRQWVNYGRPMGDGERMTIEKWHMWQQFDGGRIGRGPRKELLQPSPPPPPRRETWRTSAKDLAQAWQKKVVGYDPKSSPLLSTSEEEEG